MMKLMVKHSLICFYFCWASSLLSPSTAFQASHLAPPLVFKMIKTLMWSPKVYKRFLMIWQIKTIGNGTHFRSSIPGFSMFTSPTVAWKIILTLTSFHFMTKAPKKFSPACKARKPLSAPHQWEFCWFFCSRCSSPRQTSLGEPWWSASNAWHCWTRRWGS